MVGLTHRSILLPNRLNLDRLIIKKLKSLSVDPSRIFNTVIMDRTPVKECARIAVVLSLCLEEGELWVSFIAAIGVG
jgi:hypothetical protein